MKTDLGYDQYIPTRILFGAGQLNNLHAQPIPGKRALIVISNGKPTRDNSYLARTEEQLHRAGEETEVFDGIMPNPTVANAVARAVMTLTLLTSQHGLEHALSAYHPNLPHGAGLTMISKAYFSYFVRNHGCDDRFVELAQLLGMPDATQPEDFVTALVRL